MTGDPYLRLRPPRGTPPDEICGCSTEEALVLQGRLDPNPLACIRCNGEVPPERVPLPADLVDEIASWRNLHDALFQLWLDSGEYETWAIAELSTPGKPVQTRGLALVAKLHAIRPTYFRWFSDQSTDPPTILSRCPQCSGEFTHLVRGRACTLCRVAVCP